MTHIHTLIIPILSHCSCLTFSSCIINIPLIPPSALPSYAIAPSTLGFNDILLLVWLFETTNNFPWAEFPYRNKKGFEWNAIFVSSLAAPLIIFTGLKLAPVIMSLNIVGGRKLRRAPIPLFSMSTGSQTGEWLWLGLSLVKVWWN